jgi:lipoprotein-anchoring transpeptidase ErfK/SrfK
MLSAAVDSAKMFCLEKTPLWRWWGRLQAPGQALGNVKMRGKILVYGFAAAVAAFGFTPAHAHGDRVSVKDSYMPGTILIRTGERRLYYFVGTGEAIRYPVGVGRAGMQWAGTAFIDGKYIRPAWSPPASISRDYRRLPRVVPGGSGSNPMGAAAMTLSGGGEYAIHGTNAPGTIGGFVSHGCIRMYNEDIMDLYGRVGIGTRVVVTR